jgi:DnaK suppressor protein
MKQRGFRVHQLDQLDASRADARTDAARAEVHRSLCVAARSVLTDIDTALLRIREGKYGRCPACGNAMSVDRINALPMARLCGPCQRTQDMRDGVGARNRRHRERDRTP